MPKRRRKVRAKARKKAKRSKMTPQKKAGAFNRKAYWKAFRELQAKADKAWKKFHSSVKKKASSATIANDRNQLLLVLGECNYMARECARLAKSKKKRR
jgi:hypothetical protein